MSSFVVVVFDIAKLLPTFGAEENMAIEDPEWVWKIMA